MSSCPAGNLDSKNGAMVMDLLQALHADEATIGMVMHGPPFDKLRASRAWPKDALPQLRQAHH
jgi:ABC-type lipoprotein export system ATPase subunit